MLKDTIYAYETHRINELIFLHKVTEIMNNVLAHTDSDIPEVLNDKDVAKAFYGLSVEALSGKIKDELTVKEISTQIALKVDELIKDAVMDNNIAMVDWQTKSKITGKLLIDIGDYLIDEVRDKYSIELSFGEMDEIAKKYIDVAKTRYK